MTTWPVNYIEQDAVYQRLLEEYDKRRVQATGVFLQSFKEPTQEEWEDAYVAQTGRVPPILPGKLRWLDMKNGTIKSYTTIYKDSGEIDPTVRSIIPANPTYGCLRLLGTTRSIPQAGFPLDVTTWIEKKLLFLIIQVEGWSALISDTGFISYSVLRNGAAAPSTATEAAIILLQTLQPQMQPWTLFIFNTTTEKNGGTLVPRQSSLSAWSMATMVGTLELGVGTHTIRATSDLSGFSHQQCTIYGVFAEDPGYIEEFHYE